MNEETRELIKDLAHELGTTAEHLWGVLIKQANVQAFENIAFVIVTIVVTIGIFKMHKYFNKNKMYKEYDDFEIPTAYLSIIFGGLTTFTMILISVFDIFELPTLLVNPEYWALNELLMKL